MIEIEGVIEVAPTIRETKGLRIKEEEGGDRIRGLPEVPLRVEARHRVRPGLQDEMSQYKKKVIIDCVLIFLYFLKVTNKHKLLISKNY